ncbi:hypothetical protein NQ315_017054 [Exocentrus adspersus]|uniref:Uncharacterized protein n=1 Tax=Exocentrus adspersus TaxID=1586481 RepID=A0AAV8VH77_9CUCU|nr:hypothetical protein NQ315_017054 [Exocentrus adspersus]
MPKKSKKFDRKNAVTFHLVPRSQQDSSEVDEAISKVPLQSDENLNNRVYHSEEQDKHENLQYLKAINDNEMEWPEYVKEKFVERDKSKSRSSVTTAKGLESRLDSNKAAASGYDGNDKVSIIDRRMDEHELASKIKELVSLQQSDEDSSHSTDEEDCFSETDSEGYLDTNNDPIDISESEITAKSKIVVDKRTGLPRLGLHKKLTAKALQQLDKQTNVSKGTTDSKLLTLFTRPENETAEERRRRERMLKEYRERRKK